MSVSRSRSGTPYLTQSVIGVKNLIALQTVERSRSGTPYLTQSMIGRVAQALPASCRVFLTETKISDTLTSSRGMLVGKTGPR